MCCCCNLLNPCQVCVFESKQIKKALFISLLQTAEKLTFFPESPKLSICACCFENNNENKVYGRVKPICTGHSVYTFIKATCLDCLNEAGFIYSNEQKVRFLFTESTETHPELIFEKMRFIPVKNARSHIKTTSEISQ